MLLLVLETASRLDRRPVVVIIHNYRLYFDASQKEKEKEKKNEVATGSNFTRQSYNKTIVQCYTVLICQDNHTVLHGYNMSRQSYSVIQFQFVKIIIQYHTVLLCQDNHTMLVTLYKSPWYDLRGWLGVKQQLSIYTLQF